jgi:cyclohexanecarboxylate-CoA ligase/acyl-CoA synthetase
MEPGADPAAAAGGLSVTERYSLDRIALFREKGWWTDEHLCDHLDRHVAAAPDRSFISDTVLDLTLREFRDRAYRLAGALRTAGVQAGDRVVVQLPNWSEFGIAYLAIARIGAVIVPTMPIYRQAEISYIVGISEAVAAVTTGSFRNFDYATMYEAVAAENPSLATIVIARAEPRAGQLAFDALSGPEAGPVPSADELGPTPSPDAGHLLVFTSGTESKPKGCFHTWNTLGFSALGLGRDVFEITDDDVVFMPSPLGHATGLLVGMCIPVVMGCATHLLDVWEANSAMERIATYRCSVTASATPFVRMTLDAYDPERHDMASMRFWLCAGAPIPSSLADEAARKWPTCHIIPLYGCSEVLAATSCRLSDPVEAVTTSDGREALDGVEIRLADPTDGATVDETGEGELLYRGPGALLGYWKDPERTATTLDVDGWYHSSDLARRTDLGYVRITGRIKDLIIRGGTNISALEVEDYILGHPGVSNVACVGFPDERLGERMCAFVVAADGAAPTLEDLVAYLREERHVAPYKLPERLVVVDELPTTASGKVQKFELRKQLLPD